MEGNLDRFNLGLVFNELALEVVAVGVAPFAGDELPVGPLSDVFHSCLEEQRSALIVFLALLPQARVDILVGVGHDTLSLGEAVSLRSCAGSEGAAPRLGSTRNTL